jgi:HSP20 family protein
MSRKDTNIARTGADPFALLRQMTSELDHVFDRPFWTFRNPLRAAGQRAAGWSPEIDVFEKDGRLVTKVDLPGLKKEDVKVEVEDGYLTISGERKSETEETKDNVYRSEREYGSFYRSVPMPEGANVEDVEATFADGVLEVSVPLAKKAVAAPRRVEVQAPTDGKNAA